MSLLFSAMFLIVALSETRTLDQVPTSSAISVYSANSYVKALEESHLEKVARVAAERSILAMICEENRTRQFIANFTDNFDSLAKNGTFSKWAPLGTACATRLMENYTIYGNLAKIGNISRSNLNIDPNITVVGLAIFQDEPWTINVEMNVTMDIRSSSARWVRNVTIAASFPIENILDPLFVVGTSGNSTVKIRKVEKKIYDIGGDAEFLYHLDNMTYYENPSAPSFLMRLANQSGASSCCGISTLVNPKKVPLLANSNQSFVDYLYFRRANENCAAGSLFNVTIAAGYAPLKLDFLHIVYYNLTSKSVQVC